MKKLIIILIITICLLGLSTWGFFYLKNTFVPKVLKNLIIETVKNNTNLKINIGNITYELGKGVIIEKLALLEDIPSAGNEVLSAKRITFNVLLLPSLKGKKIIIPAIYINQPRINIKRLNDKSFNLEHYLKKNTSQAKSTLPQIIVLKVDANCAKIDFQDQSLQPAFTLALSNLNLNLKPASLRDIAFSLTSDISDSLSKAGKLAAKGRYGLESQSLKSQVELKNFDLSSIGRFINIPQINISSLSVENAKFDFKGNFKTQELSLFCQGQINNFDIKNKDLIFKGKSKFKITTYITSLMSEPQATSLSADLELFDSGVQGIEKIGSLQKINSKIKIKDNLVSLDSFQCFWQDAFVKISAKFPMSIVKGKTDKIAALIDLSADKLGIEKIIPLLPRDTSKLIENASGQTDLKAHLEIKEPYTIEKSKFNITADVKDASLKLTNFEKEISAISGEISLDNDNLKWHNLKFSIAPYAGLNSDGSLENFAAPKIKFNLTGPLLEVKAALLSKAQNLQIESLNVNSFDSWAKIKGNINLAEKDTPSLDIEVDAKLNTSNLPKWLPEMEEKIKQLNPKGIIGLKTKISGPLKQFSDWTLTLAADSESLKLYNYTLTNLKLNYAQAENLINNLNFSADSYGGTVEIAGSGQIYVKNINLDLNGQVQNMALEKLKTDLGFKDQAMAGVINANFKLNVKNPIKNNITGNGSIEIKDGNIWQMRPFEGLAKLLVIPEFSKITFKEGHAVFSIKNNRIFTQDMALTNPQMDLLGVGSLGFDGSLDFTVNCKFSEEYLKHSADLRKTITSIFTQMQEYATIQVSGNIKNPEYKIIPAKIGIDFLKPIKDLIESTQ